MARQPTALTVTAALIVALLPAHASAEPPDFDGYWRDAMALRMPLPPGALPMDESGTVEFQVTDRYSTEAHWFAGSDPSATPVVHIVEGPRRPDPPDSKRSHLYLHWTDDRISLAGWLSATGRQNPRVLSVLAACQAVDLLSSAQGLRAERVAIIGDGFGAGIALAAAALLPDRVAFVICHQPRPAFYVADGIATRSAAVADALDGISAAARAGLAYMEPRSFAARIHVPTLVIAGTADRAAPREEMQVLFEALAGPRDSMLVRGLSHCPSDDLDGITAIIERCDEFAARWRSQLVTSP